jgi:hypothetical protein
MTDTANNLPAPVFFSSLPSGNQLPIKLLLALPLEVYDGLLSKCSMMSREYLILKNGVIERDYQTTGEQLNVHILCEPQRAKFLLDLASLLFPAAVPHIEKSIAAGHDGSEETD